MPPYKAIASRLQTGDGGGTCKRWEGSTNSGQLHNEKGTLSYNGTKAIVLGHK